MTLTKLAAQTDPAEFAAMYHNPRVHTTEIAARFGIRQSRISEFAHLLGVKTRREKGIQYTPTLNRPKASQRQIAQFGCNVSCPGWQECNSQRLWAQAEPLPCEGLLDDEIGVEYDTNELTLWVMPLTVKVSLETA